MIRLSIHSLLVKSLTLCVLMSTGCSASGQTTLKEAYADDFDVGTAMGSREVPGAKHYVYPMRQDQKELDIIAREFKCITPENLMKWQYLQPENGMFNFTEADEMMDWAEENGLEVVGHTLVWHAMLPGWVFKDDNGEQVSRDELIKRMRDHIYKVVGRYKGRIKYWDVVNEAVDTREIREGGQLIERQAFLRDTPWLQIIGKEYLEMAFRFTHEADPDAILVYNDYSMTHPEKAQFVADMVRDIKANGVPVHGVGLQAHWHLQYPSADELRNAIEILADADVQVSLTELDVGVLPLVDNYQGADINKSEDLQDELNPYVHGIPDDVLERQRNKYRSIFQVLLDNSDHVERVTLWGIVDQYTWLADWPVKGRTDYPLLFDREYQPKPAYDGLIELKGGSGSW